MHPLMKTTIRTTAKPEAAYPANSQYDFSAGMWFGPDGPVCNDPAMTPQSKKADLETGEDQKGQ